MYERPSVVGPKNLERVINVLNTHYHYLVHRNR